MAQITNCREIFHKYWEAMRAYIADGDQEHLESAAELGRQAVDDGVPASGMRNLHHEAIRRIIGLMQSTDERRRCDDPTPSKGGHSFFSLTPAEAVAAAGVFFAQSMAPFEARERELRKSNVALRYQSNKLESQVHEFTQMVYDEGVQLLAAARLTLAAAAGDAGPALRSPLAEVEKLLQRVEDQLVTGSDSLRPRVLDDLGPGAAIKTLCRRLSQRAGLQVRTHIEAVRTQAQNGAALYKAVAEALSNVERHSCATAVHVYLYQEDSVVYCFVQDNGIGFDLPSVSVRMEREGSGLGSMEESLRAVGGSVVVNSVLGRGTDVRMTLDQTFVAQ